MAGRKPKTAAADTAALEQAGVDARGQISVELGGEWFVLRPSEEALAAAEEDLDLSLEQMVALAQFSRLTLAQMAVLVLHMMRAYGKANPDASAAYRASNVERLRALIFEAGVPRIRARLVPLLTGAMTGGYTAEGELKATS